MLTKALVPALAVATSLIACRSRSAPLPTKVEPAPKQAAAPLPPRVEAEDPVETAKKLEAQVQRGDPTGFYTPVGFDLVTVARDGKTATEKFPEAIHRHGEKISAGWAAPGGSLFAVGFMYTGVAGADTGVVYQKDATGPLRVAFTKAAKELATVWGRSATDVYAAGRDVLARWDGKAWKELPVDGVEGDISGVWGNGSDLFLAANGKSDGHVYARSKDGPWKKETTTRSCFLRALHGSGASVWAAGDCGLVLRREKDGTWKEERRQQGGVIMHLWASSERDVHAAAIELLHSKGNGSWAPIALPSGRVFGLAGSGRDVYALGVEGVFRSSGGAPFSRVDFDATACQVLAASEGTLHCLRERREAVKSDRNGR